MRLLVKRGHSLVNDLRFSQGPIYIGRNPKSHVFLPDRAVSRQHAICFTTDQGVWMVQDLKSANQTLVNGRPVAKMPLHEGDIIAVGDFSIEVHFDRAAVPQAQTEPVDLGETMVESHPAVPAIYKLQANQADKHPLHLTPNRLSDFYMLNVALSGSQDQEKLLAELTRLLLEQFDAYHTWAGLRETATGPLTCYCGWARSGTAITLDQLAGRNIAKRAIRDECYLLLPDIEAINSPAESSLAGIENLRSAMASPIIAPAGIYGVVYVDNGFDKESYTPQDLDYLTLVCTHLAALVEHLG